RRRDRLRGDEDRRAGGHWWRSLATVSAALVLMAALIVATRGDAERSVEAPPAPSDRPVEQVDAGEAVGSQGWAAVGLAAAGAAAVVVAVLVLRRRARRVGTLRDPAV